MGPEERNRTILNSEPACVKCVAEDGSFMSMNPAGLQSSGWPP